MLETLPPPSLTEVPYPLEKYIPHRSGLGLEAKLLLVSDLPVDVVLGMDILRTHNFSINLQTAECFLNGRSIQARRSESENRGQLHAIGPLLTSLSGEEKVRLEEFLQTELKAFEDLRGTTPLIQPY
ncbi:uncharacterized protein LOC123321877 [Coccinella septempunctata]|uniref:uncharacterized protein LOC123321877 n=1 Tax=Coccinella septempunctata TaxID=41139 RepID=UPI001D071724|nr:uncharacterized protein LOC123321877 [Coccinella septempunctata]